MNLLKARELYRPKASGWVAHNGLELVLDDGTSMVFHCSPKHGPTLCSYEEFAENLPVTNKRDIVSNLDVIYHRACLLLEQKRNYRLTEFNCEHAVSWVLEGTAKSPQATATINGGIISGGLCWLMGGNRKQILSAATIGAAIGLHSSKNRQLSS